MVDIGSRHHMLILGFERAEQYNSLLFPDESPPSTEKKVLENPEVKPGLADGI